ncbi:MAG: hypothetical protein CSA47_01645 [Gammaproteobacteria bacterium]|nr:MAG: hypothetical protein CSA47_01645 [Gammaproteobacteria bacterium]
MQTISLINLSFLLIPLVFVGIIYRRWVGERFELPYATGRMLLQLIVIGYVLVSIFTYDHLWLGVLILLFMLSVSVSIIFRNTNNKSWENFTLIFLATGLASAINLILSIVIVLNIEPFYEPKFVIPLAGMILSATMNGISLAIERFEGEIRDAESFAAARHTAFKVAMIPQVNALLAVGVVALPGMMTGQILSGVDPLVAVRYQIMIMVMSVSSAGMSIIFYFFLWQKIPSMRFSNRKA